MTLLTVFIGSIASFSGDLSSMTAPPFILSPVSLTEFPGASLYRSEVYFAYPAPAYWCERPELFSAIADAATEEDRSLAVLDWFIVSLVPLPIISRKWGKDAHCDGGRRVSRPEVTRSNRAPAVSRR